MWTKSRTIYTIIKILLLAIFIAYASLSEIEMFYHTLTSFQSESFLYNSFLCTDEEQRVHMMQELYQCASEEGVTVFSVYHGQEEEGRDSAINKLVILCDEEGKEVIRKKCGIEEKHYAVLHQDTDMVNVFFLPFTDITQYHYHRSNVISYIGEKEAVDRLYQRVGKKYGFTPLSMADGLYLNPYMARWGIIFLLLPVLAVFHIVQSRKTVAMNILQGKSRQEIVKNYMFMELLVDFSVFFLVRVILLALYTGNTINWKICLLYAAMVMVSAACYLYYSIFNYMVVFDRKPKKISIIPFLLAIVPFTYFAFQTYITTNLYRRYKDPLPRMSGKDMFGYWQKDETENYLIAAASGSGHIYAYVECLNIPGNFRINISSDKYGKGYCEIDYYVTEEEDMAIDMDTNGNYILLDYKNDKNNEMAVKAIKKYKKEIDGAIDLINERWGYHMVHYPDIDDMEEGNAL